MIGISHELLDSLRLINTPQNSLRFSEMQGEKEITTSWHTVKATLRVCLSLELFSVFLSALQSSAPARCA